MENETINDKLDRILSAKNDVKAALAGAGYDVTGGFATYGAAASSLTSAVDVCVNELSGQISSLQDAAGGVNEKIESMKEALVVPTKMEPDEVVPSCWYTAENKESNKVHQRPGNLGNFTAYKYVVKGGKTYKIKTGLGGSNTALGLFSYNDSLSTDNDNTVSCLKFFASGFEIYEEEFSFPTDEQKYILGIYNTTYTMLPENVAVTDMSPDDFRYNIVSVAQDAATAAADIQDVQNALGDRQFEPLPDEYQPTAGKFISYKTGGMSDYGQAQATDFVPCRPGDIFRFSFRIGTNIGAYGMYDENKKFLSSLNADMTQKQEGGYVYEDYLSVSQHLPSGTCADYEVEIPVGCSYIKFSSYTSNIPPGNLSSMNIKKLGGVKYDGVLEKLNRVNELSDANDRLSSIERDLYTEMPLDATETLSNSWYTQTGENKAHYNYSTAGYAAAYKALKYIVRGGKTYHIRTYLAGNAAIGLFTLNEQLSTDIGNTVSVIVGRPDSVPNAIYDLTATMPADQNEYVLGVSYNNYNVDFKLSDVIVADTRHTYGEDMSDLVRRTDELRAEFAALSADAAVGETIRVYGDKCRLGELCASTVSAWTDGTFDKGKVVFTVDDGRADAGYVASFLSSEYGFPMCFAVPYNKINNALTQSYVEDNGDGTSSTYECPFAVISDLLVAEEAFGGETYAHDSSQGRWMLSVDGQGLVPRFSEKMAEYYFIEIRSALQKLGLKVDGFVSPWHDPLDCYLPQMSKYFKYARWSTREYPNLPYQIPVTDVSSGTLDQKKAFIDQAVQNKTLLMLYTHGIGGSAAYKMKDLKELFDYVKEKVDAGVLDVTTVKALYAARQGL